MLKQAVRIQRIHELIKKVRLADDLLCPLSTNTPGKINTKILAGVKAS
jgi:hypothetical protein